RLLAAFVQHGKGHFGAGFALDHLDDFTGANILQALAVNFENEVSGQNTSFVSRCADHWARNLEQSRLPIQVDLDAHASERTFAGFLECLEIIGIEIRGIRVEPLQTAVDHVFDKLLPLFRSQFANIVVIDFGQNVDQEILQFIMLLLVLAAVWRTKRDGQTDNDDRRKSEQPSKVPARHENDSFCEEEDAGL